MKDEIENLSDDEREVFRLMYEETMRSRGIDPVRTYAMPDGSQVVDKGKLLFDLGELFEHHEAIGAVGDDDGPLEQSRVGNAQQRLLECRMGAEQG